MLLRYCDQWMPVKYWSFRKKSTASRFPWEPVIKLYGENNLVLMEAINRAVLGRGIQFNGFSKQRCINKSSAVRTMIFLASCSKTKWDIDFVGFRKCCYIMLLIMITCSSKIVQWTKTTLSKLATFPYKHWDDSKLIWNLTKSNMNRYYE